MLHNQFEDGRLKPFRGSTKDLPREGYRFPVQQVRAFGGIEYKPFPRTRDLKGRKEGFGFPKRKQQIIVFIDQETGKRTVKTIHHV
tara:strand:+ start:168 stop:425 length:258 start_codon:yes stop_codon:yes gene_type:complete